MDTLQTHLPDSIDFCPGEDFEQFLKRVPAKGAVYLLADADDRPIQLLIVGNLRYSLKRRLGGNEIIGPTRRVNYRDFVSRIHWRRVDSAFEADWIYGETARDLFPQSYRAMIGFRPAWFIHIATDDDFPRYAKTVDLSADRGLFLGPVEDKKAAVRLIEILEDVFDLCRFHNILLATPHAMACAYKEMGKCPAPCDGSISMQHYRQMLERSVAVLIDPEPFMAEQTVLMRQAAAALRFEEAAEIKARLAQVASLRKGGFRHVRERKNFRFVSLQRGPREGTAKVFIITPGGIQEIAGCIGRAPDIAEILRAHDVNPVISMPTPGTREAEYIGIVARHLFQAKKAQGVFLPLDALDEKSLSTAFGDLQMQKAPELSDEEGLLKETQSQGGAFAPAISGSLPPEYPGEGTGEHVR